MSDLSIGSLMPTEYFENQRKVSRALAKKWEPTGLLEGLRGPDKGNMATLLENQARQILNEANRTGTQSNSEEWAGIALPLVRRVFTDIAAKEFVSVQPMNMPAGLVFFLDFKYATGQPGFTTGAGKESQNDSIFGVTDARRGTQAGTGGLYGAARFGYTINDYSSSALTVTASAHVGSAQLANNTGSWAVANKTSDINFDSEFSASVVTSNKLLKIVIPTASLAGFDKEGARAFTISGTGIHTVYNKFTTLNSNNSQITFIVSGSFNSANNVVVKYHKQPDQITRGDFEEGKTQAGSNDEPLDIPTLDLEMRSEEIVAKTRKLKAQWTPEFSQDLAAYHNIDAEAELTGLLSEYITHEIDLELLDMLIKNAQTVDYWSARTGYWYDTNSQAFTQTAVANVSAYNFGTWFQTIGIKMQKVSNTIHKLTMRGGANFIVTSPDVCTILESIPGYAADTNGDKSKFAMGVQKVGALSNRFDVYKNPYMEENVMLMGYKGSSFLETGAVYAPYVPLIMTPLVLDPDNFTPKKGVMTRYAKKIVRPEFYGKIYVEGLNTI